ncbi:YhjD/YihY/BrkB family envelope integrity protein [Actinoplanes oblitus]|uniref:YhjD/YihY/BrkB family envelope integrity protein n=1 Tax=Actinoplanes oblitus TaxID=3040509 RepID=A0ABY8WHG4_9ACTN|nr:YhjD/YihY/BrkB family envelope integrity protein [Actinoplanes oblitus]WIM97314.1 YhjD/YihY/BrkB family envelope integrity protein [Actinoplanes oblitus]
MVERTVAGWQRARRRHRWLDHLARALVRYDEADGGRLAAALTYYAFFATFAFALLGFAAFGFVLDRPEVQQSLQRYLAENLPSLDVEQLRVARGTIGFVAFLGLPVTGWFWIDAMRSCIRKVWQLPEYPGRIGPRLLLDLLALVGLGLLLAASLVMAFLTVAVANRLIQPSGASAVQGRWLLTAVSFMVSIGVNTLLATAVLSGLPRLRMPLRRVVVPALIVALGLELLKTVGRVFVQHVEANPTYQVVAGTVGLLFSLNIINQLIMFAAALAATSSAGDVTDLSARASSPSRTSGRSDHAAHLAGSPDEHVGDAGWADRGERRSAGLRGEDTEQPGQLQDTTHDALRVLDPQSTTCAGADLARDDQGGESAAVQERDRGEFDVDAARAQREKNGE